jgi:hypothetical protein
VSSAFSKHFCNLIVSFHSYYLELTLTDLVSLNLDMQKSLVEVKVSNSTFYFIRNLLTDNLYSVQQLDKRG